MTDKKIWIVKKVHTWEVTAENRNEAIDNVDEEMGVYQRTEVTASRKKRCHNTYNEYMKRRKVE